MSLAAVISVEAPLRAFALRYSFHASTQAELEAARAPLRAAHLAHVHAAIASRALLLAGACGLPACEERVVKGALEPSPARAPLHLESLLIFTAAEAARSFAASDPYVLGSIVASLTVRPWVVVAAATDALR